MNNNFPVLKTARFVLREIMDTDLHSIYKGLSNPKVIKYYGVSFHTLEATKEQMTWFADDKQLWWAICDLENNIFYGASGLNDIDIQNKKAEIGLWLLPEFWGKGIMKEVLPVIAQYGINQLQLDLIEGFVETENRNCKKVMSQLDFKFEKIMNDCEIKNGKLISVDVYVMRKY